MRLLIDESLQGAVAVGLTELGHEAVHVRELGLGGTDDERLLELATAEDRVIVTADTDFGTLLALSGRSTPSVVLLRRGGRGVDERVELVHRIVSLVLDQLTAGAVISVDEGRVRIRTLPIGRATR